MCWWLTKRGSVPIDRSSIANTRTSTSAITRDDYKLPTGPVTCDNNLLKGSSNSFHTDFYVVNVCLICSEFNIWRALREAYDWTHLLRNTETQGRKQRCTVATMGFSPVLNGIAIAPLLFESWMNIWGIRIFVTQVRTKHRAIRNSIIGRYSDRRSNSLATHNILRIFFTEIKVEFQDKAFCGTPAIFCKLRGPW